MVKDTDVTNMNNASQCLVCLGFHARPVLTGQCLQQAMGAALLADTPDPDAITNSISLLKDKKRCNKSNSTYLIYHIQVSFLHIINTVLTRH